MTKIRPIRRQDSFQSYKKENYFDFKIYNIPNLDEDFSALSSYAAHQQNAIVVPRECLLSMLSYLINAINI